MDEFTWPVDMVHSAVTGDYRDYRSIPDMCAEEMEGTLWCSEVSKYVLAAEEDRNLAPAYSSHSGPSAWRRKKAEVKP